VDKRHLQREIWVPDIRDRRGFTWSINSRENRLTGWSNDPVSDFPREAIYVRDEHTGEYWSINPMPVRHDGLYIIRHGPGYSIFEHNCRGLDQTLSVFTPIEGQVKISAVKIRNRGSGERKLSLTYYLRPVLGTVEGNTSPFIVTSIEEKTGMVLIENIFSTEFKNRVAYLDSSVGERTVTGDRNEFFGDGGSLERPAVILGGGKLKGTVGAGLDPCAALQVEVKIPAGGEKTVIFLFGQESSAEEAVSAAGRFRQPETAMEELQKVMKFWDDKLGKLQVKTPDKAFDYLLNRWLLYQTISCRLWARSAFYQSGGAYGFRDQLQDSMAVLTVWPELARRQIVLHSSRQFPEGDVQHWWHAERGKGIRTKYSDDLLWLPYVTAEYVEKTGDSDILQEKSGFINAPLLKDNEQERYEIPAISDKTATLYEHCVLAIEKSLKFGEARASFDRLRGLERRHECSGMQRQRRKRVAGLVFILRASEIHSALHSARRD
jgi:cyclic beta-1,2-glucan synthetase